MLEIPELFLDDAGIYMVKAINIEGEAKCEATLTILPSTHPIPVDTEQIITQSTGSPPEFLQLFTDRQTSVNSTMKFEARLIGTEPLNVGTEEPKGLLRLSFDTVPYLGLLAVQQSASI
jgi:hypothetical protein